MGRRRGGLGTKVVRKNFANLTSKSAHDAHETNSPHVMLDRKKNTKPTPNPKWGTT